MAVKLIPKAQYGLVIKSNDYTKNNNVDLTREKQMQDIISKNGHLNFIQRAVSSNLYPKLNQDGQVVTHKMTWSTDDNGKAFVYPLVVQRNGKLEELDDESAWRHAMSTKEFIKFDNPDDADYFTKQGLIKHPNLENNILNTLRNTLYGIKD